MDDRSKVIFGNLISEKDYNKGLNSKRTYERKFGDDTGANYPVSLKKNEHIGDLLGVSDVVLEAKQDAPEFDGEKGVIIGSIRMGFGNYRTSMAIASAAHHLGYEPYWMDLSGYPDTTCTKVINEQNRQNLLFHKWSRESLTCNSLDQKNAELMAEVYRNVPKEIPLVATHAWPAQAAVHAEMKYVINAIPDNCPMAIHLAEGSIHTVQCHNAYQGYRILNGMYGKKTCMEMPRKSLIYTGHYVDHELAANIRTDCEARKNRKKEQKPMRFLLSIGGEGAQKEIFAAVIRHLLPAICMKKAVLYINVGDHKNIWDSLLEGLPQMKEYAVPYFNSWEKTVKFAEKALDPTYELPGICAFWHENIFEAVYCTNLLMRSADVLITKPDELAFYPVPKLFIRHVGKHETWGAIHSAELGDGTLECRDIPHILQMIDLFLKEETLLSDMCDNIVTNDSIGIYNGAYNVVKLAMELKDGVR